MYGLPVGPSFFPPNAHASSSTDSLSSSSSSPLISSHLKLGFGFSYTAELEGLATVSSDAASVCVPITDRSGSDDDAFKAKFFGLEDAGSGNTFSENPRSPSSVSCL